MTLLRTFTTVFAFAVLATNAFAADGDRVQYSRDSRYIYEKTPMPLNFNLSPEQAQAIMQATQRITGQLESLKDINPRTGLRGRIDKTIAESAVVFESSINSLVDYAQSYYNAIEPAGMLITKTVPTGFVVFSGFELTGGFILSGGGSVMLGAVFVPMHVTRIEIDTNKVDEYTEFDSNLILWPSANLGLGAGGGGDFRGGVGLIWGELNGAKDFAGLVVGPSVSADLGVGTNFKAQVLKNWSKKGAISNFFITAGAEMGPSAKLEGHGNISYLIDAQAYLKAGQSGVERLLNKFFGAAPDANRRADLAALPAMN